MSSLYRLLQRGKVLRPALAEGISLDTAQNIDVVFRKYAKPPDCILVNVQSVYDDLSGHVVEASRWRDITAATPPFPCMWLEFETKMKVKYAVQCLRMEKPYGHVSQFCVWGGEEGHIFGPMAHVMLPLDKLGSIAYERFIPDAGAKQEQTTGIVLRQIARPRNPLFMERMVQLNTVAIGCALHALMRMNCKNVELRPINEGKVPAHAPNVFAPATVWHEIVVTSVPKSIAGGKDVLNPGKENEIRAHWIRGHYADYRKGKGLFGKIHGLFWIPECRRGNEELGQVIPEYTVQ